MKKFFSDKKNLILVVLVAIAIVSVVIASFWEAFTPFSCIIFGVACLYVGFLLILRYVRIKNNRVDEFMTQEDSRKRKTTKFLESEGKMNNILLIALFLIMGVLLIYYSIQIFI